MPLQTASSVNAAHLSKTRTIITWPPSFPKRSSLFPVSLSKKKAAYQKLHNQILTGQVLPAYQSLIDGLYLLKGSGKNPGGLCQFAGGKAYYEYLIKSSCGIYDTVPEIQSRLIHQFQTDLSLATKLTGSSTATPTFAKDVFLPISKAQTGIPSGIFSFSAGLIDAASGLSFTSTPSAAETSPEQILEDLQNRYRPIFRLFLPPPTKSNMCIRIWRNI